jgi:hypothetical protein
VLTWLGDVADGQGPRFRRYHPNLSNGPGAADTARGPTPKE